MARNRYRPWFRDAVSMPTPIDVARYDREPRRWLGWELLPHEAQAETLADWERLLRVYVAP